MLVLGRRVLENPTVPVPRPLPRVPQGHPPLRHHGGVRLLLVVCVRGHRARVVDAAAAALGARVDRVEGTVGMSGQVALHALGPGLLRRLT